MSWRPTVSEEMGDTPSKSTPGTVCNADGSRKRADEIIGWLREYGERRMNSRLMDERRCVPPYVILDFGDQGLFGLQVEPDAGGVGLNDRDFFRVLGQLAAVDLTLATFVYLHNTNGVRPIQHFATDELRERILTRLARGRQLAAFGLSEPSAGANLAGIEGSWELQGPGVYQISGVKRWNNSAWSGVVSVFVRERRRSGRLGQLSGFVIEHDMPGVTVGPESLTMGVRAIVQNSLYLDQVAVPASHLLGAQGQGMEIVDDTLSIGRLATAAVALGAAKRATQLIARYANRRQIATGLLAENPAGRIGLTSSALKVDIVEALIEFCSAASEHGITMPIEITMIVKIVATDCLVEIADTMMQLLGGRGYMENNLAPQLYRDARLLRIGEGPNEALCLAVGRAAMQAESLVHFIEHGLANSDLAGDVRDAMLALRERLQPKPGCDQNQLHCWSGMLAGRVVIAAIVLGIMSRNRCDQQRTIASAAVNWAKKQFDQEVAAAKGDCFEECLLDVTDFGERIDRYELTIGDIEQQMAGIDHQIDPLLRRELPPSGDDAQ